MTVSVPLQSGTVGESKFSKERRSLNELMNGLRAEGVEADVGIPVVVSTGSQSAGKSSVVEAISGIKLPRASGTCTRCPMEIRMLGGVEGTLWTCQIKIRQAYDDAKGVLKSATVSEVPFGPAIDDPDKVESAVRRAQLAVLNPSVSAEKFVDCDLQSHGSSPPLDLKKQLSFSKNVVILEIKSSTGSNLTFIDLPGLIQSSREGEDVSSPQIIKELAETYISQPTTIILLTVSMETELENQEALKLARAHDQAGSRTIGLLTKPDVVRGTTVGQWIPIIKGERERLVHNWFIVKRPDVADGHNAPSADVARAEEMQYFDGLCKDPIWKPLADDQYRSRMGIENLTHKLSDVLCSLNRESLPAIRQSISDSLDQTRSALEALPKQPHGSASSFVLSRITDFAQATRKELEGRADKGSKGFAQSRNKLWETFRINVRDTAPHFVPFPAPQPEDPARAYVEPAFLLDGAAPTPSLDPAAAAPALTMNLTDVRSLIEEAKTNELPGDVPADVKQQLILQSIQGWNVLSDGCLVKCYKLLDQVMADLVDSYFGRWEIGGLKTKFKETINAQLAAALKNTIVHLNFIHRLDGTRNRDKPRVTDAWKEQNIAFLANFGIVATKKTVEAEVARIQNRGAPDDFESSLAIMAGVRAYFQVSYKRIADDIPRAIQASLIDDFALGFQDALLASIQPSGPDADERCGKLTGEPVELSSRRAELNSKKERLEKAMAKLASF